MQGWLGNGIVVQWWMWQRTAYTWWDTPSHTRRWVQLDGVRATRWRIRSSQVLIPPSEGLMGSVVEVVITSASRWSVTATVLGVVHAAGAPKAQVVPEAPGTPTKAGAGRRPMATKEQTGPPRVVDWVLWQCVLVSALGVLVGVLLKYISDN